MNLIGDPRKQNTDILFVTEKLKGETAVIADVYGYNMQQPALRKLVRRGKTKIQDSFKCHTGDKKPVVVKIFALTRNNVNKSTASRMRRLVKQLTVNKVSKMSFKDFVGDVIEGKFQKEMKSNISKIYPLRIMEYNTVKMMFSPKGKFEKPMEITDELMEKLAPKKPVERKEVPKEKPAK